MAVTNLVKEQEFSHAKRIAEFAIDAIAAANDTLIDPENPDKGYVNIRVGFHSGPVVADVVGVSNCRCCFLPLLSSFCLLILQVHSFLDHKCRHDHQGIACSETL
jgi:Adenylate and Guanylate cyclase catalytic domain